MTIIVLTIVFITLVLGLAGVVANGANTHELTGNFAVFGYHVTGSTGVLFLYGIAVGAIGAAGLSMVLLAARSTARRAAEARRELALYKPAPAYRPRPDNPTWQQRLRTRKNALAQPDPPAEPTHHEPAAQSEDHHPPPRDLRRSATPTPHGTYTGDRNEDIRRSRRLRAKCRGRLRDLHSATRSDRSTLTGDIPRVPRQRIFSGIVSSACSTCTASSVAALSSSPEHVRTTSRTRATRRS